MKFINAAVQSMPCQSESESLCLRLQIECINWPHRPVLAGCEHARGQAIYFGLNQIEINDF